MSSVLILLRVSIFFCDIFLMPLLSRYQVTDIFLTLAPLPSLDRSCCLTTNSHCYLVLTTLNLLTKFISFCHSHSNHCCRVNISKVQHESCSALLTYLQWQPGGLCTDFYNGIPSLVWTFPSRSIFWYKPRVNGWYIFVEWMIKYYNICVSAPAKCTSSWSSDILYVLSHCVSLNLLFFPLTYNNDLLLQDLSLRCVACVPLYMLPSPTLVKISS
jgi:hypothetical protein